MEPFKHPHAVVETEAIGLRSRIAAFSHVACDARVGCDTSIGEHTSVGSGAVIGDCVQIGSGVEIAEHVIIEDGAQVGPNATIGATGNGDRAATIIRGHAVIGAGAVIEAGLVVGLRARVGIGSVVTTDVPPHVEVFGNPARIIGYGSSQPPTQRVEDSFAGGDVGVGGSRLVNLPTLADLRGSLTFAEVGGQLPFTPQRLFMVYQVPSGEVRGEHAHRELHQLLLCVAGACTVAVDDGRARIEVTLDDPSVALYVPPLVWDTLYGFSPDAQLVVLASDVYDPQDYIRDYDEFVQVANASHR